MSTRIDRLNNLFKEEISAILLKRENFDKDVLVTVSRVVISKGLNEAKIFISVIPDEEEKEVVTVLKKDIYSIQQELNKKLFLRKIPRIIFYQEKEIKKVNRIEELLLEIKKKDKE